MSSRNLLCSVAILPIIALVACGGGSGIVGPTPPQPSFNLSLSPDMVTLAQSGTQNVQVTAIPKNGFSATIAVTVSGLPPAVTVSPPSLSLDANSTGTLTFSAASNAASGNVQVSLTAISGSQQAIASLSLSVTQTANPVAMPFTITGGGIEKALYDESRQLLFATNLSLNEVDVLSGKDLSLHARIPVGQPFGIDQMLDGKTLIVGTATQGFYTIDENTLLATYHKAPNFTQLMSTMILLTPVTMANGKVLFLGQDIGLATAGSYVFAGQSIVEWDSATGQFTQPFYVPFLTFTIDHLKRSADRNWAVFAADKLYIYNAQTDSLSSSAIPVNSAPFGVRDIAANPDGSQFAVASASSVSFYDSAFNLLGTLDFGSLGGLLFTGANATTQYSADGGSLYWELFGNQGGGSVLDVVNTNSFTDTGNIASNYGIQTQFEPNFLLVDSQQRAFFSALGGVGTLNATKLRSGPPTMMGGLAPNPFSIPLNQAVAVTLNLTNDHLPSGTSVTIGGRLVPIQATNPIVVQAPPSAVAGPVDLVVTQPDGSSLLEPQSFVYGVELSSATSSMAPPIGNPVISLFGFGMLNGPTSAPSVAVGGQTITNLAVNPQANQIFQQLFLQLPNAPSGPADITVTGNNGTSTLKAGIIYIPSAAVVPASGLLQLLYDGHRNLLYALQSTQIQVLNPTTLTWQSPLRPGGTLGGNYVAFTITPDGSKLLVLDSTTNSVIIFNPDNPLQDTSVGLALSMGAGVNSSIAATSTGKAFIGTINGLPIEVDIANGSIKTLSANLGGLAKFVATPDGTHMFALNESDTRGTLAVWNSSTDSFATQGLSGVIWTDVAVSPNGNRFAAVQGNLSFAGVAIRLFDGTLHFTNATVYPDLAPPDQPFCTGTIFSASGQTLMSPLSDSIDFFNTTTRKMIGQLAAPGLLPTGDASAGVLALNPNEQTIYAISASGLNVLVLPSTVDQIAPFPWPHVAAPSNPLNSAAIRQNPSLLSPAFNGIVQKRYH